MDIKSYINSGILELYVYGALSEEESAEVTRILKQYPEILEEVEEIERSLMNLSAAVAPGDPEYLINSIKEKLNGQTKVYPISRRKNWSAYIGWAASILLMFGLFYMFNKNNELRESLQSMQADKVRMESEIAGARDDAQKTRELLNVLRDRDILKIPLPGQEVAPEAYATAYWDRETNTTYIDARDLPRPPAGMVYQVWSLELQPLTPTSIGLLDDFEEDQNKIFALENTNVSQAFGITLEPEGGSDTPTMDQLYALGVIAS